jgi:hypothetical protein
LPENSQIALSEQRVLGKLALSKMSWAHWKLYFDMAYFVWLSTANREPDEYEQHPPTDFELEQIDDFYPISNQL